MPTCEVHNCKYTTGKSVEFYRMQRFPDPVKKPLQFAQWCTFAKGKNAHRLLNTNRRAFICSKHFLPSDVVEADVLKLKLLSATDPTFNLRRPCFHVQYKPGTVPTLYPSDPDYESPVPCDCEKIVKMRLKRSNKNTNKSDNKNKKDEINEELDEKQKLQRLDNLINDAEKVLSKPMKRFCKTKQPSKKCNETAQPKGDSQWVMVHTESKKSSSHSANLPSVDEGTSCTLSEPNVILSELPSEKFATNTKSEFVYIPKVKTESIDSSEILPGNTSKPQADAWQSSETSQTSCSMAEVKEEIVNDDTSELLESENNIIEKCETEISEFLDDNFVERNKEQFQQLASQEQISYTDQSHMQQPSNLSAANKIMSLHIPLSEVFKLLGRNRVEHEPCQSCGAISVHVEVLSQPYRCVCLCLQYHVVPCTRH